MFYLVRLAYDGTDYHGWQMQQSDRTVAGVLQETFEVAFQAEASMVGASRTDTGVHAYDQVLRVRTPMTIEPERLVQVWNRKLPRDIVIRAARCVTERVHPQHQVLEKTYWYHFFLQQPAPFLGRYGWYVDAPVNVELLREMLALCVGTHDFRAFCTGEYDDTTCTITHLSLEWVSRYDAYRIVVKGPRFLYRMVRRIVGAALYAAARPHIGVRGFEEIFLSKSPCHQLTSAPAHGLLLRKIVYTQQQPSNEF